MPDRAPQASVANGPAPRQNPRSPNSSAGRRRGAERPHETPACDGRVAEPGSRLERMTRGSWRGILSARSIGTAGSLLLG